MFVVDASPLIHLARVSLLDLLRELEPPRQVVVPLVVFEEVMRGVRQDPFTGLVEKATLEWLRIVPSPPPHPRVNSLKIDPGETAVLSVALSMSEAVVVVLDDLAARAEADRLGIPKIGTLRLLLDAKDQGLISSVLIPLNRLQVMGMRLSEPVYREVLRQAGELT